MKLNSLEDLFINALPYVYDAEKQLTEGMPKLATAATIPELREAFEHRAKESDEHVRRIEQIFTKLGKKPEAKTNTVVQAMRQEADNMMRNIDASPLRDAALVVAANQLEHYEIAAYGSIRKFAQLLGRQDVAGLLEQTLNEEKKADAKVTEIGEKYVNTQAAHRTTTAGMH